MGGNSLSVELDTLELKVQSNADQAALKVDKLTSALNNLKGITKGGVGLTTVANQLSKLNGALSGLNINSKKITELKSALSGLSDVQKSTGLTSIINALKKLPQISKELSATDLSKFADQMTQVANAVRPLASEMEKVSAGFKAFPIRIQKLISSNTGLAASNKTAGKSFAFLGSGLSGVITKLGIYGYTLKRSVGKWITSYNDYVENVNLFTVAMGKFADESMEYAERVQSAAGIDLSEWIRNQSVLMDMVKGYGVVEDKAKTMSEGLTQLIYDYASFYNIGIEDSAQKVQSAIAGEIEPVRRLGKDLSVTTLQQYAYKYGIDQSVNSMTQAQKAQLRYVALMDQSKSAMGDMARTIQTPANAMRILQQQVQQLTRALGSLFIPILQVVIPWVQAFVSVLTDAVRAIAGFFGVELPTIDYSGIDNIGTSAGAATDEIEDTTGALGDAAAAAKKLKDYTLGFDELNILNPDTGTASGGIGGSGGASGGSYGGDLDLPIESYNFLDGLNEQANSLKKTIKSILPIVAAIGAGILAWKISNKFAGNLGSLKRLAGLTAISIGVALELKNINNIFSGEYDNVSLESAVNSMISGAMVGIGATLLGAGAWAIPVAIALMPVVTEIATNWDNIKSIGADNFEGIGSLFEGDFGGAMDSFASSWATQLGADSWGTKIIEALVGKEQTAALKKALEEKGGAFIEEAFSGNFLYEGLKIQSEGWSDSFDYLGNHFKNVGDFFTEGLPNFFNDTLPQSANRAIEDIKKAWNSVSEWFNNNVITPISDFFKGLWDNISSFFTGLWTDIQNIWSTVSEWFNSNVIEPIVTSFNGLKMRVSQFFEGLWLIVQAVWKIVSEWFNTNVIEPIVGFFSGLWEKVSGFFTQLWEDIQSVWNSVSEWFNTNVITPVTGFFKNLWDQVSGFFTQLWEDIQGIWGSVSEWFNTNVIQPVTGFFKGVWTNVSGFFTNLWTDIQGVWNNVSQWFDQNVIRPVIGAFDTVTSSISGAFSSAWLAVRQGAANAMNGVISGIESAINWIVDGINRLLGGFNNVASWAGNVLGKKWGGVTLLQRVYLGRVSVPQYASGGFPTPGQLFVANEPGNPEMIGSIGGRTAVANNEQITEAIAAAVYNAVVSAQAQQADRPIQINETINLDGRAVYRNQRQVEQAQGYRMTTSTIPV